jgi:ABC-type Mn2+/Zn2+ transport system ATPase subunit
LKQDPVEIWLSIQEGEVGYEGRVILKEVNFTLTPGSLWVFVGPNGSGKTTLLKVVARILKIDRGKISFHPLLRTPSSIGYTPQRFYPSPFLSLRVEEFLSLSFYRLPLLKDEKRERWGEIQERLSLSPLLHRRLHELSGGEERRILLARALLRDPLLLLLDEPTQGLDRESETTIRKELLHFHGRGDRSVILVTHDPEEISFATHIGVFFQGRFTGGERNEMENHPLFSRLFPKR